jgi:hypothetical protein
MLSTIGLGQGVTVDHNGVNIRFNGRPVGGFFLRNGASKKVYAMANVIVIADPADGGGATTPVDILPSSNLPADGGNFPLLTPTQVIAQGIEIPVSGTQEFIGFDTHQAGATLNRLALVTLATETSVVTGGVHRVP